MAYDTALADRIRVLLANGTASPSRRCSAGSRSVIGGNMAVAASGQGGILVRVDPESRKRSSRRGPQRQW